MMPLDTRIVVRLEQTDNSALVFPLWCDEQKSSQEDFADFATIRSVSVRRFVIRYNQAIASSPVQAVYVEDANGRIWNADSVEKSDDRKRFITIRGLSENTAVPVVPDTPETPLDPMDMTVGAYALAATVESGIRRYARTVNMINTADFYESGFPRRMQATFVNGEVIVNPTDGPRSTFSQDEVLDVDEQNESGGPVSGDQTGRLFDAPDTAPSEEMAYFIIYWLDRGGEPDSIVSFEFV